MSLSALAAPKRFSSVAPQQNPLLFLDKNEMPLPPGLIPGEVMADALGYSSPSRLEGTLAAHWHLESSQVLVGAGSSEILKLAFLEAARKDPHAEIVLPTPGFFLFPLWAQQAGLAIREVPWNGVFPVEALLAAVTPRTRILCLATPNNPTGISVSEGDLLALASGLQSKAPEAVLIVDAAYIEFAPTDATQSLLRHFNSVIVTRTFSKAWGLGGLRVGWAMGATHLLEPLRDWRQDWPVAAASLAAAQYAFENLTPFLIQRVARVRANRHAIRGMLVQKGYAPLPSDANFLFVPGDPQRISAALLKDGIVARTFGKEGQNGIRISVPADIRQCERVIEALGGV